MAQIPNPFGGGGSGGGGGGAGTCGTLGGDLSGTCTSGEVTGILSNALPALSTGYLNWNGSAWVFTSGTGANAALSNLASVSINTALLFQTTTDVGSTTKPARNLYLYGTGTYGTNYFQITGAPTSTRTITIPDTTDTLVTLAATQTLTNKSIAASQLTGQVAVANGGTGTTSPALVAGTNVTITGSWPNQTINSSGGGGGGTGNAAATHSVTFSATPTYTCSSASAGTVEEFTLSTALSANVTSSTLATCTAGEVLNFTYTQSAASGPFTVVMPTNFDACPVSPTASAVTTCGYSYDGTNGRLVGSTSNDTPSVLLLSATRAAPTVVPSGGAAWPDSTDNDFEYRQTGGGSIFKMFLSGGDANPVTGVVSKINGTAFSGTSGHLVSFGAANIPADSGVVAANAVVASSPGAGLRTLRRFYADRHKFGCVPNRRRFGCLAICQWRNWERSLGNEPSVFQRLGHQSCHGSSRVSNVRLRRFVRFRHGTELHIGTHLHSGDRRFNYLLDHDAKYRGRDPGCQQWCRRSPSQVSRQFGFGVGRLESECARAPRLRWYVLGDWCRSWERASRREPSPRQER